MKGQVIRCSRCGIELRIEHATIYHQPANDDEYEAWECWSCGQVDYYKAKSRGQDITRRRMKKEVIDAIE